MPKLRAPVTPGAAGPGRGASRVRIAFERTTDAHAIMRAATACMPRVDGGLAEGPALALVFEKVSQGAILPHDTVLCVDDRGIVQSVFAPGAAKAGGPPCRPSSIVGGTLTEALDALRAAGAPSGDAPERALVLDLYPLVTRGGRGVVAVVRGDAARPAADARYGEEGGGAGRDGMPAGRAGSHRRRAFLLDWGRVRYLELRSGLVHACMAGGGMLATDYSLADVLARTDRRDFFRIHRDVIVNLSFVREIERYGQGRLRLVLDGPDAPTFVVSRPASAALRKILKC